jgi:hypothetical protein
VSGLGAWGDGRGRERGRDAGAAAVKDQGRTGRVPDCCAGCWAETATSRAALAGTQQQLELRAGPPAGSSSGGRFVSAVGVPATTHSHRRTAGGMPPRALTAHQVLIALPHPSVSHTMHAALVASMLRAPPVSPRRPKPLSSPTYHERIKPSLTLLNRWTASCWYSGTCQPTSRCGWWTSVAAPAACCCRSPRSSPPGTSQVRASPPPPPPPLHPTAPNPQLALRTRTSAHARGPCTLHAQRLRLPTALAATNRLRLPTALAATNRHQPPRAPPAGVEIEPYKYRLTAITSRAQMSR